MFQSFTLGLAALFASLGGINPYDEGISLDNLVASVEINQLFDTVELQGTIPKFYSRKEWGANEKFRLKSFFNRLFGGTRSLPPEAKDLPTWMRPKIVERKWNGQDLYWPIEENQVIKKITVHHTAEAVDERRSPMTLMRAIYYYHTKKKGWGDIGYNFVIDKRGNIYEGRAGGEKAVGAHTAFRNTANIGIALMGNFEIERPTKRQLRSLEILSAHIAFNEQIDPVKSQSFLGTHSHNIAGHRDVAHHDHGTACPGRHLHARLPEIRRNVQNIIAKIKDLKRTNTRDRIGKYSSHKVVQRGRLEDDQEVIPEISFGAIVKKTTLQRGTQSVVDITMRNGTRYSWPRGSTIKVGNVPDGMVLTSFTSLKDIRPGDEGVFRSKIKVIDTPNGVYDIALKENLAAVGKQETDMSVPIQVSGDKLSFFQSFQASTFKKPTKRSLRNIRRARRPIRANSREATQKKIKADASQYGENVKIKIALFEGPFAQVSSKDWVKISHKKRTLQDVAPDTMIKLTAKESGVTIQVGDETWIASGVELKTFSQDGVLKIHNYDRGFGSTAYNQFRRQLNIHRLRHDELLVVNELPKEQYLWGLAEEPTSEPIEKKHAIHVLARSYVTVYGGNRRKFGTLLYDLEDDPRTSQFYLGYDWERYHHEQKAIVAQTHGEVITKDGVPVIGPYFTQSAGQSLDIWQSQYPWAKARELPYDKGLEQKGHGVGLSGNSARMLANKGWKYPAILDYFFEGLELKKQY